MINKQELSQRKAVINHSQNNGKAQLMKVKTMEESPMDKLEKQIQIISSKINKIDLSTRKPPFIPFTFAEWRSEALEALESSTSKMSLSERQDIKRKFISRIDGDMLFQFCRKMRQPYFDLIFFDNYAIPKGLDFQAARKDYKLFKDLECLASQIAEWCIQIEISADLVERSELYNYFSCEKSEKEIYSELKEQLQGEAGSTSFGEKLRGIAKKTVSYSMKSLSNLIWSKGLALSNISMGALILLYYSFIGTTSLPIQLLMPKVHVSWLVGGIVGSFALNQVADSIERGEVANNLHKVMEIFKEITINLLDFNSTCENAITDCALARSQEEINEKCICNNKKQIPFKKFTEIEQISWNFCYFDAFLHQKIDLKKVIRELLDNAEKLTEIRERVSKLRNIVERTDDADEDLVLIELEDVKQAKSIEESNSNDGSTP